MKFILLLVLTLTACSQVRPVPIPPVQHVYCVTPEQYAVLIKEEPAKVGGTLTGDARDDVKTEGGSNVLLRQYADNLLEVIGSCTK